MKSKILAASLLALSLMACSKEEALMPQNLSTSTSIEAGISKQDFAVALSKAIEKTPRLADVLRNEALKQFDNNTDVLYHLVKDIEVNSGNTVEMLIANEWSRGNKDFQERVDASPLLNIFASDLEVFDESLGLGSWNTAKEVAVATVSANGNKVLYVAGDSVASVGSKEIPAIPTFVIGDNRRVEVASTLRNGEQGVRYNYSFLHEAYKGRERTQLRNEYVQEAPDDDSWIRDTDLSPKHIYAFENSGDELYKQRALLYYSDNTEGVDYSFSEYLYRFKIAPEAYHNIAGADSEQDDPKITGETVVTYARRDATIDEIISKIWTKGSFAFSFEVVTPLSSGNTINHKLVFSVSPKELFIMNPDRERRHPTLFRKTRYTYRLKAERLESRWVYPHKIGTKTYARIDGSWDLSKQGLSKVIRVFELDKGTKKNYTETFGSEFFVGTNIKASNIIKAIGLSADVSSHYKATKTISSTVAYNDSDDDLGVAVLYFTDPFFLYRTTPYDEEFGLSDDEILRAAFPLYDIYQPKDISTGIVTMSFLPLRYK